MINNDMLDQRSPMGNLWHGVQAIAQRDKKKKNKKQSLSHLLQCPSSFVNDPDGEGQRAKRVPKWEKVRR